MKKYLMIIDEGTTGTRTIIFDDKFNMISKAYQELTLITPDGEKVEQSFDEIYDKSVENCCAAMKEAGITADDVAAIGITSQRNTICIWDAETGKPYRNGIVWQDTRVGKLMEEKGQAHQDWVMEINGCKVMFWNSDLVLEWLMKDDPRIKEDLISGKALFGSVDTWLIWKLTGGKSYKVCSSMVSSLGFFDPRKDQYSEDIIGAIGLPTSIFPEIVDDNANFGETDVFGATIPITGAVADQQSSLFGQNCRIAGTAKCTNGTGSFMDINIGHEFAYPSAGLTTMVAWTINGERTYMYEGNLPVSGSAVQWLRDGLGIIEKSSDTYDLATSVDDTNGVYFAINLSGAMIPKSDPFARGALIGISRNTTQAHIVRATLEGIAFGIAGIMEATAEQSGIKMQNIKIDGGASMNNFLAQCMADFIDCDIYRPKIAEGTAFGAAEITALGCGMYTLENLPDPMEYDSIFKPELSEEERAEKTYFYKKAAASSLGWLSKN